MQSIILVVEHRHCECGEVYIAPNPKQLTGRELSNFERAIIYVPDEIPRNKAIREIFHTDTKIEVCPKCFIPHNTRQLDLFPVEDPPEPKPLIFTNGQLKEKPAPKKNPYGLDYF